MFEPVVKLGGRGRRGSVGEFTSPTRLILSSASTAPGLAVLRMAGDNGFSSQHGDMGGSSGVSRAAAGPIAAGQPVRANENPVARFAVEVPMTSDRTVIFTCGRKNKDGHQLHSDGIWKSAVVSSC